MTVRFPFSTNFPSTASEVYWKSNRQQGSLNEFSLPALDDLLSSNTPAFPTPQGGRRSGFVFSMPITDIHTPSFLFFTLQYQDSQTVKTPVEGNGSASTRYCERLNNREARLWEELQEARAREREEDWEIKKFQNLHLQSSGSNPAQVQSQTHTRAWPETLSVRINASSFRLPPSDG